MALPSLPELAVFMALVLVLSLYSLTVSGHFPAEHRAPALRTGAGRVILWGTIALCIALALTTVAFAWARVPLYAAVIGGAPWRSSRLSCCSLCPTASSTAGGRFSHSPA